MTRLRDSIRKRCSYANVTASLALFLALTGGAYAAATLPRNSVGSAQIRSGAVNSSELRNGGVQSKDVRDGTLEAKDLSTSARRSLRGSPGPAGAPAVTFRASIAASGDPAAGNATGVTHSAGSNDYRVSFSSDISACIPTATLAKIPISAPADPPAGRITVATAGNAVTVKTFDAAGAPAPVGFNVLVGC
jgi:hypothetical protein